ncbi:hypothetical protein LBMAG52_39170 [Planctomycetia bacterium]|nr:hypothetical protein LBMAG52_39170 [Planctomycetia bacterium]
MKIHSALEAGGRVVKKETVTSWDRFQAQSIWGIPADSGWHWWWPFWMSSGVDAGSPGDYSHDQGTVFPHDAGGGDVGGGFDAGGSFDAGGDFGGGGDGCG